MGILPGIRVFKGGSVEMFAYCLFDDSAGHCHEIVLFA
jgi:hypothetical protein